MSFPPPPTSAIDWPNLGFVIHPTAGHIQTTYKASSGWSPPRLVRSPILPLHGLCAGLNYGQQCYEGLKAFRTSSPASIHLFRPDRNALRLIHSASFVSMPAPPADLFLTCVGMAVSLNAEYVPPASDSGAGLYVRPLLFGSSPQLGLSPGDEYTFCVFVAPVGVYHGASPVKALLLESFDRAAPRGTGSAKVGGNYAPVLRHSEAAREKGFGITLHVDAQTRSTVEEFSTSGFIGVKRDGDGNRVLVVPKSDGIIDSVTSECVQTIAEKVLGWKVQVRVVSVDELDEFEEVFAAGTAAALVPVKSIETESGSWKKEYATAEDGGPAEAVRTLLDKLRGLQTGRYEDVFGWRYPVGLVEIDEDGFKI